MMRQEQRLTPQLIQSMDILQLPLAALEARVNEELDRNPMLERIEEHAHAGNGKHKTAEPESPAGQPEEAQSFSRLERMCREYDFDDGDRFYGRPAVSEDGRDAKMDAMANTASRPVSLQEHLLQQWAFEEIPERIRKAGELIINYIDDDGWLHTDLAEIARQVQPPLSNDIMVEALQAVQKLEPAGIGARNLEECLVIQLDQLPGDHELERILIRRHLQDIQKNRYPAISRSTGSSIDQIKDAVARIAKLHPKPGYLIVEREAPRVMPDVIIDYADDGDGYIVRLARGNSPRLRISQTYEKMLKGQQRGKEEKEFLRKNLEAARALMDAITYRRDRLLQLAKVVVERQRDFFEQGPQGLKILRMSQLADEFGCDPSTISRTVADKYLQTPRGIYPLRYFFTGGTESASGESTSWDSVRNRVKEIIETEDTREPLSDDAVVEKLQAEGLNVSRRTIAKYRAQLNIPPARQRQQY